MKPPAKLIPKVKPRSSHHAAFGKDRTVLVVAHRPATILAADEVVVMDQGRIIDQGTNAELQSRCSLYWLWWVSRLIFPTKEVILGA